MKGKKVLALLMATTIFFTNGGFVNAANKTENVESVTLIEEQELIQEEVPVCGTENTVGNEVPVWEYSALSENEVRINKYNGNDTNVCIPSVIDGKTVRSLRTSVFMGSNNIETVYIPETIKYMQTIETSIFADIPTLKEINVSPNNGVFFSKEGVLFVRKAGETDGEPVLLKFPEGKNMDTYSIPAGTVSIMQHAFYKCPNLKRIIVPESVDLVATESFIYLEKANIILKQTDPSQIDLVDSFYELDNCVIIVKNEKMRKATEIELDVCPTTVVKATEKLTAEEKKDYLVPATSLTFDGKTTNQDLPLERGESREISYHILPADTTDTVTWTCDNDEVVQLNTKNGKTTIYALENGNCTITGTTDSREHQITLNVTVWTPLEKAEIEYDWEINPKYITQDFDEFYEGIYFNIYPYNATCRDNVTWKNSNPEIIKIKKTYKRRVDNHYSHEADLTLNKPGTTTITATLKDGSNVITKSVKITVTKDIFDCKIASVSDVTYTGKKVKPKVVIKDGNTTLKEGVDYTVSCEDIEPMEDAVVKIQGIGNYTGETWTYFDIKKSKVKTQKITNISSSYKKAYKSTFSLKPKAKTSCSYKSSNKKVATVNSKGKVIIKGTGKATITITAKATSKYKKATKKVTIYAVPAKMKTPTVKAGSKKLTVKWEKDVKADGYQIQYSTNKKFKKAKTVTVSKKTTTKETIKKLKKGKRYYVRIRAYKKIDNKKYYGSYSKVKNVKVK